MRLLVTRPEPDNERTAAALRVRGHEVMLAPLLRVEPIADAVLGAGPWAAILITSANGARAIARHQRHRELTSLPVLAVGEASAAAARTVGFKDVTSAAGDGGDLARLAALRFAGSTLPLLYLAGEERARDLASEVAMTGLKVTTAVVYRAVKEAAFPLQVSAALGAGAIDGVLHFSRRSVESYLDCAKAALGPALEPVHYCLSARAAEPLESAGAARIRVAEHPDEASLLALVTLTP
jgi:uroporphyrinogen-III synthase